MEQKETASLEKELKKHVFDILGGNKELLQEFKNLCEQLVDLNREFNEKVELLILRLVDIGQLKGSCDICGGESKEAEKKEHGWTHARA